MGRIRRPGGKYSPVPKKKYDFYADFYVFFLRCCRSQVKEQV